MNFSRQAPWLLSILLVSACHKAPLAGSTVAYSVKPNAHKLLTAAGAAQAGSLVVRGRLAATPGMLLAPAGAVHLQGTVQLDASYAISKAGATLLATAAGRATTMEGGHLVGAALIATDGTTLVSKDHGNLIADNGAGVISNDGGSIVSGNSSRLVAQGGGNAVAAHPAGYELASVGSQTVALGTQLPAAGMVVQVRTLGDNTPVAVGTDAQGHPAYALYTDLAGKFEVFLPASLDQNVRIIATPRTKTDPKLQYSVIGMTNAPAQIDEDTSQTAKYIMTSVTGRVNQLLTSTPTQVAAMAPVFGEFDAVLNAAGQRGQVANLAPAERLKLAAQVTSQLMAPVDFTKATFVDTDGTAANCARVMTELVAVTRENMAYRMLALQAAGQDPTAALAAEPAMQPADLLGLKIEKPADFIDILVQTQMSNLDESELDRFGRIHAFVLALGLPTDDSRLVRMAAASTGLTTYMAGSIKTNPAIAQQALDLIHTAN